MLMLLKNCEGKYYFSEMWIMMLVKKKAKLEELSNTISGRSEASGTAILSDLLVRSRRRFTGKSAK